MDESASVEAAWSLATGAGATIAIIDDGVDIDHEELRTSGKIVAPRDATFGTSNPRPGNGDRHGTACAGVACANGNFGASGVAPGARLIPIRLASELGSQNEADAFVWAAQNGADVISCSWGPADGDFRNPNDPTHLQNAPLPDSTRLAIDFAATQGRGGKGCVVLFAAGNGNESVDLDGYASHQNVIAVAACNDRGKKSPYSDFGNAIWCAFPSNNFFPSLTKGIWTMDNTGNTGYNPGDPAKGDAAGNYTNSFGGTSSACPGAAGVAALVIARNPQLRREEVREILKQCADKIDTAGGNYDAQGRSPLYGFGRLNARRAVELAVPATPTPVVEVTVTQDVPIKDLKTSDRVAAGGRVSTGGQPVGGRGHRAHVHRRSRGLARPARGNWRADHQAARSRRRANRQPAPKLQRRHDTGARRRAGQGAHRQVDAACARPGARRRGPDPVGDAHHRARVISGFTPRPRIHGFSSMSFSA